MLLGFALSLQKTACYRIITKMEIFRFGIVLALSLFPVVFAAGGWINDWNQRLEFKCPSETKFISAIQSIHSNQYEDRRFIMNCSNVPLDKRRSGSCKWSGYLNNFEERVFFNCGRNCYINGMRSYYSSYPKDRRWRIKTCTMTYGLRLIDCSWTSYTNNFDGNQNYSAPTGYVTTGVYSYHDNRSGDRRWKFKICKARVSSGIDTLLDVLGKRTQAETQDIGNSEDKEDSL